MLSIHVNKLKKANRSSRRGAAETSPTRNHEVSGLAPGLAQWVKDLALREPWCIGHRHGLDLVLL